MDKIYSVVLIALFVLLMMCIILDIKNVNTYKQLRRVLDACHDYNAQEIKRAYNSGKRLSMQLISYSEIKSYDASLYNLFDWGYKHLVPNDVFEKIKPYIK